VISGTPPCPCLEAAHRTSLHVPNMEVWDFAASDAGIMLVPMLPLHSNVWPALKGIIRTLVVRGEVTAHGLPFSGAPAVGGEPYPGEDLFDIGSVPPSCGALSSARHVAHVYITSKYLMVSELPYHKQYSNGCTKYTPQRNRLEIRQL